MSNHCSGVGDVLQKLYKSVVLGVDTMSIHLSGVGDVLQTVYKSIALGVGR
jgi:hypothetical protein